jgi:GxxExxY protein
VSDLDFNVTGVLDMNLFDEELTEQIIKSAIEVHRYLGPGLLESAYEECLCCELEQIKITFERQKMLPVVYKGKQLQAAYRIDLLVEGRVLIELKSVEKLLPVHNAQLLTYLRLTGLKTGLLLNFNAALLKDGLRRFVL